METALIILAPLRMIPPCSAFEPTMKPVMLCRKTSGVSVWLQSWMNWAAFFASSENRMPLLPSRPTGKPWIDPQPHTSLSPYSGLNSSKRLPSRRRA